MVAVETLDLLAREALDMIANKYYAGIKGESLASMTTGNTPSMNDLRRIVLDMKKLLVKPRSDKHFHVIAGPEFYYDMITDPLVEKYMRFNKDTYTMYSDNALVPMFGMAFYETLSAPESGVFYSGTGQRSVRVMANAVNGAGTGVEGLVFGTAILPSDSTIAGLAATSGYEKDSRTGKDASYNPNKFELVIGGTGVPSVNGSAGTAPTKWFKANYDATTGAYTGVTEVATPGTISGAKELKVSSVFVLGKDALVRTSLKGQGDAKMIVKSLGSAGVNDPLNQRQSIGFKINSVGFGNARAEAVACYMCVPTSLNV